MISAQYCRTMARYNAWQNNAVLAELRVMDVAELTRERGVFFSTLLGTLNHLLWGDLIWMGRFDGGEPPVGGIADSPDLTADLESYALLRFQTDARILHWAKHLKDLDLVGHFTWHSGAAGLDVNKPIALCVAHFFNHQTHHRGQVHAILTGLGVQTQSTDLFLMPEDI